jgi:hypothetical protein
LEIAYAQLNLNFSSKVNKFLPHAEMIGFGYPSFLTMVAVKYAEPFQTPVRVSEKILGFGAMNNPRESISGDTVLSLKHVSGSGF